MALRAAGARRVLPLNVSGPFHSPLLKGAGDKLSGQLAPVRLSDPQIPYVTNVTAGYVRDKEHIKEYLKEQVSSPVKWQQSVEAMAADGVDTFVEIGPGKALSGFFKKTAPGIRTCHIDTAADFHSVVSALKGVTA